MSTTNLTSLSVLGAEHTPLLSQHDVSLKDLSEEISQVITYTRMALQQQGKHSHALLFANASMHLHCKLQVLELQTGWTSTMM